MQTPSPEYRKQNIILKDGMIELHHNPLITNRCYHFRFVTYDGYADMTISKKDLIEMTQSILEFVQEEQND